MVLTIAFRHLCTLLFSVYCIHRICDNNSNSSELQSHLDTWKEKRIHTSCKRLDTTAEQITITTDAATVAAAGTHSNSNSWFFFCMISFCNLLHIYFSTTSALIFDAATSVVAYVIRIWMCVCDYCIEILAIIFSTAGFVLRRLLCVRQRMRLYVIISYEFPPIS